MSVAFTLLSLGAQTRLHDAMPSVRSTATMTRAGSSNPDHFVHYRVPTIVGATINSVGEVHAAADWELLDESDAHIGDGFGISSDCLV
jgi:hypothetical protein